MYKKYNIFRSFIYPVTRIMALFPTLLLAMTLAYGQNVKISKDPFKTSPSINEIEWTEQPENNIVYCTSDRDDVVQMRFDCPDCNKTLSFDWYALSTDKTTDAGFPVLQLSNVPGYKVLNGKTLECQVQFGTENAQPNPQTGQSASKQRATAMMKVRYLDVPQSMSDNHPPVYLGAQIGNAFHLACTRNTRTGRCTPSQSLSLNCFADGNPRPNLLENQNVSFQKNLKEFQKMGPGLCGPCGKKFNQSVFLTLIFKPNVFDIHYDG